MVFEPIAVVGQSCILPGALTPQELVDLVLAGKDELSKVPDGYWRTATEHVLTDSPKDARDQTWSDKGGYIKGFDDIFDPEGFKLPAHEIMAYDRLVRWTLHGAREALKDANALFKKDLKAGIIFGNLSYPSHGLTQYSEAVWLDAQGKNFLNSTSRELAGITRPNALNRFMSGLPAHVTAQALDLGGTAFAIDAACASSLYAIKLACDELHDRKADLMLAGGVNRADDLIIHIGFCVLQAMSHTGQSRPFHKNADGLVPAEGAGFIALKRLDDAIRDKDIIHGVIRGVGVANDARGHGLLVPSAEGQARAIESAYAMSGIKPSEISLLECHATGTKVGDGIEIKSTGQIFKGLSGIPIGTIKSNIGHPITVSGIAGLIKVMGSMKAGIRPRTLHVEKPHDDLNGSPFRLLTKNEPWETNGTIKRAGISNFGFGGNNAHLIVEEWKGGSHTPFEQKEKRPNIDIAIVGMGVVAADLVGKEAFSEVLFNGTSRLRKNSEGMFGGFTESIELPLLGLNFPPADLKQTLPQQLMILKASMEAINEIGKLPREKTCVFVGMGCDAEVSRGAMGWKLKQLVTDWTGKKNVDDLEPWIAEARSSINPYGQAPAVLGAMPNIVTNRISSQYDIGGPGFSVSSEELSGIRGLDLGMRALRSGEMDVALVGAVDICCEQVHETATQDVLPKEKHIPGDGAIILVLKRLEDARKNKDIIYAILPDDIRDSADLRFGSEKNAIHIEPVFGHIHAASGLFYVGAAALSCHHGMVPKGSNASNPWPTKTDRSISCEVSITGLGHVSNKIRLVEDKTSEKVPLVLTDKTALKKGSGNHSTLSGRTVFYHVHPPNVTFPPLPDSWRENDIQNKYVIPGETMQRHPDPKQGKSQFMAKAPAVPSIMKNINSSPQKSEMIPNTTQNPQELPETRVAAQGNQLFQPTPIVYEPGQEDGILRVIVENNILTSNSAREFYEISSHIQKQFLEQRQNTLEILLNAAGQSSELNVQYRDPQIERESALFETRASYGSEQAMEPAEYEDILPPSSLETEEKAPAFQPEPVAKPLEVKAKAKNPKPELRVVKNEETKASKKPTAMDALRRQFENPVKIEPKGPSFNKDQLRILASGKISEVFGPLFEQQDKYDIQVRLPEDPLLLVDRITGIDAVPGSMEKGIMWTETDVTEDAWYLHDIYMPGGITIESGQCDLTLISYLGIDFLNKGERAYRLLGCDLMYYGAPPKVGETLCYQIHVDGHANMGGQRMFFFHYDCRVNDELRLSVRNGQAAFITPEEAENAGGVIWDPKTGEHKPLEESIVIPPEAACTHTKFSKDQIKAFSEGRAYECFGDGFEILASHTKTPKIPSGMMCLLHEVTEFDPKGGPWGRGYIRVENKISSDDWFLPGHFKNDPCMPGTLMSDACMQTLAFYLTAMGFTIKRDGWRFDPVPNEVYQARCRAQVTPSSKDLSYEAFIEEVILVDGLYPTVFADLVATCDGRKSLHIRRLGIRLVPDFPLDCWPHLLDNHTEKKEVAVKDGFKFDYRSLMACAYGKPSDAFGELGRHFDKGHHIARLPGPPYHFMTRVTRVDATMGGMNRNGEVVEVEYDIPKDAWYFDENGRRTMPFCVLMEVALQPCGWLAVFEGGVATSPEPLLFRNLDGTGTQFHEITPDTGTILTRAKLTSISLIKGMSLFNFDVESYVGDTLVYSMKTGFGFFLRTVFEEQFGLPMKEEVRKKAIADFTAPSDFMVDLTQCPSEYCARDLRLPKPMLLMIDRITGFWPEGGEKGIGRLRAEKDVNIHEWFFKAHFFQDPVQPGSLGIEALVQLLQFYMIHTNMDKGIENPKFEPIAIDKSITWRYRGQVTPMNKTIGSEMNIIEVGTDDKGPFAVAEGWLWVDGRRIYHAKDLTIRIVPGGPEPSGKPEKEVTNETLLQTSDNRSDLSGMDTIARSLGVPVSMLTLSDDGKTAFSKNMPLNCFPLTTDKDSGKPIISLENCHLNLENCHLNMDKILNYGRNLIGYEPWLGEDLCRGMCNTFVNRVILEDHEGFAAVKGKNVIYLANHQI